MSAVAGPDDRKARRFSVQGLADHFSVTKRTVLRWIEEGKVDAEKDPGGQRWIIYLTISRERMTTDDNLT